MHTLATRSALLSFSVFCACFCALVCAAIFFAAPKIFFGRGESAWRGYTVLFVWRDFPEQAVLDLCAQEGIENVITLSSQKPFSLPSGVTRDAQIPAVFLRAEAAAYEQKKANFFFDQQRVFRLYYVEDSHARSLFNVAKRLAQLGIECGVNAPKNRSIAVPVLCAIAYLFFCLMAKNRSIMALGGIFFVGFALNAATESAGSLSCLALYSLFLLQMTDLRKGFFLAWLKKIPNALSLALLLALVCVQFRLLPFFLVSLAGSVSSLYAYGVFATKLNSRKGSAFQPVPVMNARVLPVLTLRSLAFFSLPAAASIVFFALYVSQGAFLPKAQNSIRLPSPTAVSRAGGFTLESYARFLPNANSHNQSLPSLAELIMLSWESLVFPYKPLRGEKSVQKGEKELVEPGEKITIPEFSQSETGTITEQSLEYVFDESFISSIIFETERNGGPVLEKVLLKQERFTALDYAHMGEQRRFSVMGALALAGMLPLTTVFVLIKGKKIDDWSN
jgi:hypothetical protein